MIKNNKHQHRIIRPPVFPRQNSVPELQQLVVVKKEEKPQENPLSIAESSRPGSKSTYPFNENASNRFSYQFQRDPNFSLAKAAAGPHNGGTASFN